MTSQLCTEESTFSPIVEGGHSIEKSTFLPALFTTTTQATTNGDPNVDFTETSPLTLVVDGNGGQKTQPVTTANPREPPPPGSTYGNRKNTPPSFCHRHWGKLLTIVLVVLFMLMTTMALFIVWILNELSKIKEPKSVMLYRPTTEYLENDDRPETIRWRLVEEHSQSPFTQLNSTHLHVTEGGFYHISCSMLMETNSPHTNVITLLIFYSNDKKSIYTKQSLPTGFGRFSLQQSIVLHLKKGAYFYAQLFPSKYLLKDPDASYLSIVRQ